MRANKPSEIELFVFESTEPENSRRSEGEDLFDRAMFPKNDFLPGAMLACSPKALEAAKKVVEAAVRDVAPSATVTWNGTSAVVKSKSEGVLDHVEIHGASYDSEHDEATGVRFDITGLRARAKKT